MKTLTSKLAFASLFLTIIVGLVVDYVVSIETTNYFVERLQNELSKDSWQIQKFLAGESTRDESFSSTVRFMEETFHQSEHRLTLIDSVGVVVYDSDVRNDSLRFLTNHSDRPEIKEASQKITGSSIRFSESTHHDMLYVARAVERPLLFRNENKQVLIKFIRVSVSLVNVKIIVESARSTIMAGAGIVIALVVLLSFFIAKRLTSPIIHMAVIAEEIRKGNLSKRITHVSKDEIGKLATTLNEMLDTLQADIVQLRKLERVRSEFLGNVSHELRTPIFSMQGMLETLLGGAIDDPAVNRDFLQKTLKNVERLNSLLGDLIDISRIESGEMKLRFRYFNVSEFLETVVEEMQLVAQLKNISFSFSSEQNNVEAFGDKDRLRQVMTNLIDNAIKYSEAKSFVTVRLHDKEDTVEISVSDTGYGIAAEHLPRIFERFYRVDQDRSRALGGTGLGLAIVKHIVEAHGSFINVQSEIGKGTTFTFYIWKTSPKGITS